MPDTLRRSASAVTTGEPSANARHGMAERYSSKLSSSRSMLASTTSNGCPFARIDV